MLFHRKSGGGQPRCFSWTGSSFWFPHPVSILFYSFILFALHSCKKAAIAPCITITFKTRLPVFQDCQDRTSPVRGVKNHYFNLAFGPGLGSETSCWRQGWGNLSEPPVQQRKPYMATSRCWLSKLIRCDFRLKCPDIINEQIRMASSFLVTILNRKQLSYIYTVSKEKKQQTCRKNHMHCEFIIPRCREWIEILGWANSEKYFNYLSCLEKPCEDLFLKKK